MATISGIVLLDIGENQQQVSEAGVEITETTNTGGSSTSLTTSEMSGTTAKSNMAALEFTDIWTTTSEYPKLQD